MENERENEVQLGAVMVGVPERARLMVTYAGQQGDLPETVDPNMSDADIKQIATEALRTGHIVGITAVEANLDDFVVERFKATDELPARCCLRPKTPFGR